MSTDVESPKAPKQNHEFVKDLQGLWRIARYFIVIAVCVLGIMAMGQIYAAYDMLAAIPPQPWVGVGFVALVVVLLGILVGLPLARFFRLSAVVRPPAMPEHREDLRPAHLKERMNYLDLYLGQMKKNPLLQNRTGEFSEVEDALPIFGAEQARAAMPACRIS